MDQDTRGDMDRALNVYEAVVVFEETCDNLIDVEKIEDGTNKFRIITDENGYNDQFSSRRDWLVVELHETWFDTDSGELTFEVSLWIDDDE